MTDMSLASEGVATAPAGSLDLSTPNRLALHDAFFVDDFTSFAREMRDELLSFPGWKIMRLGLGPSYAFQTGITTGHIDGRYPELVYCHRYEQLLNDATPRLAELVQVDPKI